MIKSLIITNPSWHRTRLSKEICELWNWKRPNGSLKDMACRTMLLKLEKGEYLKLPKLRRKSMIKTVCFVYGQTNGLVK